MASVMDNVRGGTDAWSSMYILVHWWPSSFSFEKLDMAFHQLTSLSAPRCLYANCAYCTVSLQTRRSEIDTDVNFWPVLHEMTTVMGNVRVAHYRASFHKNVIFVKTRHCFICPPSLAARMRFKNWHPCQFLNFEFLRSKNVDTAFHQLTSLSAPRCFCRAKTSQGWLVYTSSSEICA